MNQHKIRYEVLNSHNPNGETGRIWQIDVQAPAADLQEFAKSGVLSGKAYSTG